MAAVSNTDLAETIATLKGLTSIVLAAQPLSQQQQVCQALVHVEQLCVPPKVVVHMGQHRFLRRHGQMVSHNSQFNGLNSLLLRLQTNRQRLCSTLP